MDDALERKKSSIGRLPVADYAAEALAKGGSSDRDVPVTREVAEAFARVGGGGVLQENSYQEIPIDRSTSARVEESAGILRENSHQETPTGGLPDAILTTEALACVRGAVDCGSYILPRTMRRKVVPGFHRNLPIRKIQT